MPTPVKPEHRAHQCGRRRSLAATCRRGATAWALPETAKPSDSAERSNSRPAACVPRSRRSRYEGDRRHMRQGCEGRHLRRPWDFSTAASPEGDAGEKRRLIDALAGRHHEGEAYGGAVIRKIAMGGSPEAAGIRPPRTQATDAFVESAAVAACRRIGIVWSVRHPTGARRVHPLADRLVRVGRDHIPSRGERTGESEKPPVNSRRVTCVCTPAA